MKMFKQRLLDLCSFCLLTTRFPGNQNSIVIFIIMLIAYLTLKFYSETANINNFIRISLIAIKYRSLYRYFIQNDLVNLGRKNLIILELDTYIITTL